MCIQYYTIRSRATFQRPAFPVSRMANDTFSQLMAEYTVGWILIHEHGWLDCRQYQVNHSMMKKTLSVMKLTYISVCFCCLQVHDQTYEPLHQVLWQFYSSGTSIKHYTIHQVHVHYILGLYCAKYFIVWIHMYQTYHTD